MFFLQAIKDLYLEWKVMKVKEQEEAETQAQFEAMQSKKHLCCVNRIVFVTGESPVTR